MKFSEQWLREWLLSNIDREELLERLTMSGLEVDGIEPAAGDFSGVVVARVLNLKPHPDAEKLKICEIECGESSPLQIVCGASNVRTRMQVPLARIGARLPGDIEIKLTQLRGIDSHGMLCSARELGLAEESEGLLELSPDLQVGMDLREALSLDDHIIELSLTPNRGDCLGILGIARDAAVLSDADLKALEVPSVAAVTDDKREICLSSPEACPRYVGRIIRDVDLNRPTPSWMVERLRRSDVRSINPVVDITNYVMLELGQPMHAFDNQKLTGAINVRYAKAGEKLTLLDGEVYELKPTTLVIADDDKALAMAGIMGGQDSAVDESSTEIFLESAFFSPQSIIGHARQYGLHTDSSHRFERGVDYQLQQLAIERATQLILDICGGRPGPVQEHSIDDSLPKSGQIRLRANRIQRVLGMSVDKDRIETILTKLGMELDKTDTGWHVRPPSYRFDIAIEVDLIEEIARVIGYDHIPEISLTAPLAIHSVVTTEDLLKQVQNVLINRGYQQAITYSFIDPAKQSLFDPDIEAIKLANPIASDMSVMRTSLIPGLLETVRYNVHRQQSRPRFFEEGLIFRKSPELEQIHKLAGVIYGPAYPEQWGLEVRQSDYFDLKGDIETLLLAITTGRKLEFSSFEHPALHPGQCGGILFDNQPVGYLGMLHPAVNRAFDLDKACFVFELTISSIFVEKMVKYRQISRFPSVRRDISILIDEEIPVAEVIKSIQDLGIDCLKNLELFDLYQGESIDIGKKSLTFGLTFQKSSSTLIDIEVESLVGDIIDSLHKQYEAKLRE